jgi:outer membrane receptor protein involved in Fe transport
MLLRMIPGKKCAALSVFLVVAISIVGADRAYAQVSGATLSGTVKDPSGAGIPNAQVTVTDTATRVTHGVTTNSAGLYSAPNLLPAIYEVSVTAPGFSTQVRKGIMLTVGAQQELDVSMQVGEVSQTVEVTAEAPTVELTSSTLSAEVGATTVRELPLNGRSWVDLGSLQPGVNQPNTQKPLTVAGRGQRGFGTQVSITGTRPDENLYRLDGINVNDYSNSSPSNISGGATGVDAIQEFSVLTGNAPAQYGRSSGGIFNAITRSGTNQFHGSAYEFLRNSAMDARNFFDPAQIPPFRRNQFGVSAGGPIHKDSTFIFGDYEGLRQSLGVSQTGTTLSNNARNGILSTGNVTVDPDIAAFLATDILPVANGPLLGAGNTARFTNSVTQPTSDNFWTTRFDQKFSEKDSLDGVYSFDSGSLLVPDLQDTKLGLFSSRHHSVAIEENHVFSPSATNAFRVGFNRSIGSIGSTPTAVNPAAGSSAFAAFPGGYAVGTSIPGVSAFSGGLNGPPFYFFHYNSYQVYDDAFLTKGIHQLKAGFSFEREQDNDGALQGLDGTFTFKTLPAFLQNQPSKFAAALASPGTTERGIRESILGLYIQDDIRLRSNLTVNVGLRYEFATVPTEVHNEITNMVPDTAAQPVLGSPYFSNFTHRNFQPRIGFSYDPFKDGKTAIRGGFGIYDMLPLPYEIFLGNATTAPFFEQGSYNSVCPNPATGPATCLNGTFPGTALPFLSGNPKTFKYSYVDPNSKRRYIMQWNLNIQRQIAPGLTFMVGYVGSRGLHLPQHQDDMDFVIPTLTSAGYVFPFGAGVQKLNPNAGVLVGEEMQNHSWYDAMQVEVTKTLSHGLMLHGSYTWGRNIDYSSGTFAGDSFGNGETTQPWFNPQIWRGLTDFNISQNLIINGTWSLPSPMGEEGFAGHVLGGWQLGAIFKANGGVPFTPNFGAGGDPAGVRGSDTSFETPNRLTGSGCSTLVNPGNPNDYIKAQCFAIPAAPSMAFWTANCNPKPGGVAVPFPECFNLFGNAGRNILIGPGLVNMDFSVFKNNYVKRISETFNAQFRWEVFNIFNRANFSVPSSTSIFDAAGNSVSANDLITTTQTPSRQMQVALKLIW